MENVYENIREGFDSAVLKMRSSLQNPRYRELIFYVLLSMLLGEGLKKRSDRGKKNPGNGLIQVPDGSV